MTNGNTPSGLTQNVRRRRFNGASSGATGPRRFNEASGAKGPRRFNVPHLEGQDPDALTGHHQERRDPDVSTGLHLERRDITETQTVAVTLVRWSDI